MAMVQALINLYDTIPGALASWLNMEIAGQKTAVIVLIGCAFDNDGNLRLHDSVGNDGNEGNLPASDGNEEAENAKTS